jgi:hypothetical protein
VAVLFLLQRLVCALELLGEAGSGELSGWGALIRLVDSRAMVLGAEKDASASGGATRKLETTELTADSGKETRTVMKWAQKMPKMM